MYVTAVADQWIFQNFFVLTQRETTNNICVVGDSWHADYINYDYDNNSNDTQISIMP